MAISGLGIFTKKDANSKILAGRIIAVIGYGNQGRAQALNLRDSGIQVIIGNRKDDYQELARKDGFEVSDIPSAVANTSI
jgi:ketol-acid reductoisomerase